MKIYSFLVLTFCSISLSYAQIGYPLEYSMPEMTSVPPTYPGQPFEVSTAYYYFDLLMRTNREYSVDSFFYAMGNSDTARFIAAGIYRVNDDNPLSFFRWYSCL